MNARPHIRSDLEAILGYTFRDHALLTRALSHASAIAPERRVLDSYQRLEFLGDRVLALAVSNMLYDAFQSADEGELARRLNQLVMRDTCAAVAADIGLGDHVILGEGEARSGGRQKAAILADVCEAVIAALYLDGGFQAAAQFIDRHWRPRMEAGAGHRSDAKTTLQEWAQGKGCAPPRYEEIDRTGPDHAPVFTIAVNVEGEDRVTGTGRSKREAEQAAASALLVHAGIWDSDNE